MSMLTKTRRSRAARRIGRSRSHTARLEPSGSMASNWLYRADNLTDTLTRGNGPWSSRSMRSLAGQALTSRLRPSISSRYSSRDSSASFSVIVASPSRSTVKASDRRRRRATASNASCRFDPAMNLRASRSGEDVGGAGHQTGRAGRGSAAAAGRAASSRARGRRPRRNTRGGGASRRPANAAAAGHRRNGTAGA